MVRIILLALLSLICLGQDEQGYQIETVTTGFTFADGPVWSKEGYLLVSDPPTNQILKVTGGKAANSVFRENSEGSSGNAFDEKGRLYTCESRARRLVRSEKKSVEVLADHWQGKRLNGPVNVVVSKHGDIYFTDSAFGSQVPLRELDFNGLYHLTPKGQLELVSKYKGRPNGVALSADGKILFVSVSEDRQIRAFDVDAKSGQVSGERNFISDIPGIPAGIRAGPEGNLYVAAKNLLVYSSAGTLTRTIEMREKPSNCAFGDAADSHTLFVTARTSVYRVRFNPSAETPSKPTARSQGGGNL